MILAKNRKLGLRIDKYGRKGKDADIEISINNKDNFFSILLSLKCFRIFCKELGKTKDTKALRSEFKHGKGTRLLRKLFDKKNKMLLSYHTISFSSDHPPKLVYGWIDPDNYKKIDLDYLKKTGISRGFQISYDTSNPKSQGKNHSMSSLGFSRKSFLKFREICLKACKKL